MKYKSLHDNVEPEHKFYSNDGRAFSTLKEAHEGLKGMHKDTFDHHVNPQRNDLSNWVKDVFQDQKLSESLLKAKDAKHASSIIGSRLGEVSVKIKKPPQKDLKKKVNVKQAPVQTRSVKVKPRIYKRKNQHFPSSTK